MRPSLLGAISAGGGAAADAALPTGFEYLAEDACTAAFYAATTPAIFYDSVGNTTWICYEGWDGVNRLHRVCTYNHSTGVWLGPYTAITETIVDDDHGVPAMAMDASGYVHIFGDSHNTPLHHATTTNPRDPSSWSSPAAIDDGTYPHPVMVGSELFMFFRNSPYSNAGRLMVQRTSTYVSGVPTFGTAIFLANFGTNTTRWYQGNNVVRGTDIHMVASRADLDDTTRQDVYYIIYDTITGTLKNFAGTANVAVPVGRTELDDNFRIVDQTTTSRLGNLAYLYIDDAGVSWVTYNDGTDDTDYRGYLINSANGWASPQEIAAFATNSVLHRYDSAIVTGSATPGALDIWATATSGSFTRGGKITKRTRAANGTLSSAVDVKSPDRTFALDPITASHNAHPDIRVAFAERYTTDISAEQQLRVYVAGDQGIVERGIQAPASLNIDFTTSTMNGATLVCSRDLAGFASKVDGSWQAFAANVPRITNKGLLIETAGTNLLANGQNFGASSWTKLGIAVTQDAMADADGSVLMDMLNKNVSSTTRRAEQSITGTVDTTYTFAANLKANSHGSATLRAVLGSGASVIKKLFNLSTGAISDPTGGPFLTGYVSSGAEDLGNGIWRCSLTVTSPSSDTTHIFGIAPGDDGVTTQGTIYAGVTQVEIGTTASSGIVGTALNTVRPTDLVYVGVPRTVTTITYTFDDDSTQQISPVVDPDFYQIPTNLNRRYIKTIVGS